MVPSYNDSISKKHYMCNYSYYQARYTEIHTKREIHPAALLRTVH